MGFIPIFTERTEIFAHVESKERDRSGDVMIAIKKGGSDDLQVTNNARLSCDMEAIVEQAEVLSDTLFCANDEDSTCGDLVCPDAEEVTDQ